MSTCEQRGLQPGEFATAVTAHVVGEHGTSGVSLAPDASWVSASLNEGPTAPVVYHATVYEVTEVTQYGGMRGRIVATTEPPTELNQPGTVSTIHSGFNGYMGGRRNPTDAALREAGVTITTQPEGATGRDIQRVQVENPWKTVGQYTNNAILLDVVTPPSHFITRPRRVAQR